MSHNTMFRVSQRRFSSWLGLYKSATSHRPIELKVPDNLPKHIIDAETELQTTNMSLSVWDTNNARNLKIACSLYEHTVKTFELNRLKRNYAVMRLAEIEKELKNTPHCQPLEDEARFLKCMFL